MKTDIIKIIFALFIGLSSCASNAQEGFIIEGKVTGNHEGKKVVLTYKDWPDNGTITDSVLVKDGSFVFKGKVNDVVRARLALKELVEEYDPTGWQKRVGADEQEFLLENTTFKVSGSNIRLGLIEGGPAQADNQKLRNQTNPLENEKLPLVRKMMQYSNEKNEKAREELFPKLQALNTELFKIRDDFFNQHPDSYVSLYLLEDKSSIIEPSSFEPLFNTLSPRIKNSAMGKVLASRLNAAKVVDVGGPAIDFVQNDTNGKPVSLSSHKGKYVLLEFWASWCGPCRSENPNLVKAYAKFKDKNFEIIAVSLDHKKDAWLKAIEEDGLPWIHVSDLAGVKNAVAVQYDARAVPQNFLISPEGKIIAKNLRGEQLEVILSKMINN